jgi:putative SOS response-associated peptidase YedK
MCGRFSNKVPKSELKKLGVDVPDEFGHDINICPTDEVWAFGKSRKLGTVRWGIEGSQSLVINARSETVQEKVMFRDDFSNGHRCLIPCDSFYEFPVVKDRKACVRFHPRDLGVWMMAGIFKKKFITEKEFQWQMAILTTSANHVVLPYHDRMPVLIGEDKIDKWLMGKGGSIQSLFDPIDANRVGVMEVTPELRSSSFKGEHAHDLYSPPESFGWL